MTSIRFCLLAGYGFLGATAMRAFVAKSRFSKGYDAKAALPVLGDLHEKYEDLPSPCEYLVQVHASSVNPSDIGPSVAEYPHVLGSDVAGVVAGVGPGCTRFGLNDSVWGDIGANTRTTGGRKTKELGAYGEFTLALETQLAPMPKNLDFQEAAALPKVGLTGYKALVWYAGALNDTLWTKQPTVLVLGGAGGTGTVGIQMAKAFGAGTVITTCSANNTAYCKGLGADRVIDYHAQNWWEVLASDSVEVVYDTVGQSGTGDYAMDKLRAGGHYVTIVGALAKNVKPGVTQNTFINSDTNLSNGPELSGLTKLVEDEKVRMKRIDGVFTLDQVGDAFKTSEAGHVVGKLVVSVP